MTDLELAQLMNTHSLQGGNNDSPWWLLFARAVERAALSEATTARVLELEQKNAELETYIMRQEVRIGDLAGCVQKLKDLNGEMFASRCQLHQECQDFIDALDSLFDELDDADKLGDGRVNTTRVREVLAQVGGERADQAWDRRAEQITREALGDDVTRPINPDAKSIDDL